MKAALLLNADNQILQFIDEKKCIKMMVKDKVEVLSVWIDSSFKLLNKKVFLPAVLRLKYFVHRKFKLMISIFSRTAIFKRDNFSCQYCGIFLKPDQLTIDHILPRSKGGKSTFTNCVAACAQCNKKKANKTAIEAQMRLLTEPQIPRGYIFRLDVGNNWHSDWEAFLVS